MRPALSLAALAVLSFAPAAGAQSILASSGLGVPLAPVDARAHALGGIGIGLFGPNPSLANPAELAGFPYRGVAASVQSSARSIDFGGQSADAGANRFPLVSVIYPVGARTVLGIGYGGFLDQSWAVATDGFEVIGSDSVAVRDIVESNGGLAQFHFGASYSFSPALAVGVAAGVYTGGLTRLVSRSFTDSDFNEIGDFEQRFQWSQRAPFVSAGFRWDPGSIFRLAGSVTWAGTLDVEADDRSAAAQNLSVDLPLQVAFGASAALTPQLTGNIAARWAGWSRAADGFDPAVAPDDTWEIGGGIEWGGATLGSRPLPIRLGYQRRQYPFRVRGELPTEWAASLGLGLHLARTEYGPLASVDATLDRGGREAAGAGIAEDFWRFTVSLSLFGR